MAAIRPVQVEAGPAGGRFQPSLKASLRRGGATPARGRGRSRARAPSRAPQCEGVDARERLSVHERAEEERAGRRKVLEQPYGREIDPLSRGREPDQQSARGDARQPQEDRGPRVPAKVYSPAGQPAKGEGTCRERQE